MSRAPDRAARQDRLIPIPAVFEGCGLLGAKSKELMALADAVTKHCDACTACTRRSVSQRAAAGGLAGVAMLMNGGLGKVHAPRAFEVFQELGKT